MSHGILILMSSPQQKRDVVRLRTFADDVAKARGKGGTIPEDVLPNEVPKPQGVFHQIRKKDLELAEAPQGTALDTDGVKFDADQAAQVEEQAYAASQAIKEQDRRQALVEAVSDPVTPSAMAQAANMPVSPTPVTSAPKAGTVVLPPRMRPAPAAPAPTENLGGIERAETVDKIQPPPPITLGDAGAQEVTSDDIHSGEIVADRKRERFKLIPAIGEAVTDWFEDTKDQIEEAQKEKYTVAKIDSRVDTIKAAAQAKTLAPEEDYAQVAERLKQVERTAAPDVPVLVKPKTVTQGQWSHTIPEDGETQTPVAITPMSTPEATPISVTPQQPVSTTPAPAPILTQPQVTVTSAPTQIVNPPREANYSAADIDSLAAAAATPPPPRGVGFTMPTVSLPDLSATREYLPSPAMAILVLLIAIVAGVGTSIFFFWQPNETVVYDQPTTQPLFTALQQTNIDLTTHPETMRTLLAAINSNSNTVYLYLTDPGSGEPLSPAAVMQFLAPQVPGSFARSVTSVSFGGDQNRPFLVLKVNNFDAAFSGMLDWERTMSADLAPLFGPVVTESFDPQARTSDQTRSAFFRDIVASNLSSRLLADERAEDRIIYAFIDKQTIVIATDRLQLSNILPLIR